jgi:hypothetical protein
MVAYANISQNKLSTRPPNGTSIVCPKFDAGSSVSPLNNSTYLSFQSWPKAHGGLSVDSNLSIPYTQISKEKLELAELLKLVDPRQTTKRRINRIFTPFTHITGQIRNQ